MIKKLYKLLVSLIFIILSSYFIKVVIDLDLLPINYLSILIALMVILNLIADVFLFMRKKWTKVISIITYILITVISVVGIKYGNETIEFLNKGFDNLKTEVTTYNVIVLSKSSYKEINDLTNRDMGYLNIDQNKDKVINEINKNVTLEMKEHEDLFDMYIKFTQGLLTSLVLDEAQMDILAEAYSKLDSTIKVIYTFSIETNVVEEEEDKKVSVSANGRNNINKGASFSIYLSGSDSRSNKIYNKTRSDVNMIITVNPDTKTILLTSIPRDYYVMVHGQTGLKDKLTHSGIYGMETSRKTVEDLFNIDIEYTIKVGMNSVVELVDIVGGIEVYSDTSFDSSHISGWHVNKGMNYMDGKKALAYARERYAYSSGDRHRIQNQQQVLEATLEKVISSENLLLKYDSILNSLNKFYLTDIPRSKISEYVKMQLNDMASWEFISQSVDGTGNLNYCHVTPKTKLYVIEPDEITVNTARNKIIEVMEAR